MPRGGRNCRLRPGLPPRLRGREQGRADHRHVPVARLRGPDHLQRLQGRRVYRAGTVCRTDGYSLLFRGGDPLGAAHNHRAQPRPEYRATAGRAHQDHRRGRWLLEPGQRRPLHLWPVHRLIDAPGGHPAAGRHAPLPAPAALSSGLADSQHSQCPQRRAGSLPILRRPGAGRCAHGVPGPGRRTGGGLRGGPHQQHPQHELPSGRILRQHRREHPRDP